MAKAATATKPAKAGKGAGKAKGAAKAPKAVKAPKAPKAEPAQADFLGTAGSVVAEAEGVTVRTATAEDAASVADFMGSSSAEPQGTAPGSDFMGTEATGSETVPEAETAWSLPENPVEGVDYILGPDGLAYPPGFVATGLTHYEGDTYTDEAGVLVDRFGRELFPPEDTGDAPAPEGIPAITITGQEGVEAVDLGELGGDVEEDVRPSHLVEAERQRREEAEAAAFQAAKAERKAAAAAPGIGHNNPPPDDGPLGAAAEELKAFVDRLDNLQAEKDGIQEDIKNVFAEIKGRGYDAKIVRKILALKKRDASELQEENELMQVYAQALGLDFLV